MQMSLLRSGERKAVEQKLYQLGRFIAIAEQLLRDDIDEELRQRLQAEGRDALEKTGVTLNQALDDEDEQ